MIVKWIGQKFSHMGLVLIILLGLGLSSQTTTQAETPPQTASEIQLWHAYTGEQETTLNQIVETFNAENEWGITVNANNMQNTGRLYDQIILNLLADDYQTRLPNLVITNPDNAALFALSGHIVDLTPYTNELDTTNFLPDILEIGQNTAGAQILLPTHLHTEVLVVNETALAEMNAEIPHNATEFGEIACDFRQQGGWSQGKFGTVWSAYLPMRGNFVTALLTAQGETLYEDGAWQFTSPDNATLLSTLANYHQSACTTVTDDPAIALDEFAAGKALFYFAHTSDLPNLEIAIASNYIEPFAWQAYPLLAADGAPQWVDAQGLSMIQHAEEQDLASWHFMEWFISGRVHFSEWLDVTAGFPIQVDVGDDLATSGELSSQLGQIWDFIKNEHVHKSAMASGEVIYFEIENTWRNIYLNFSDANLELETLTPRLNEIMDNFGD